MTEQPIEDVPPSAKLVYKVLEYNGGLTQKEIVEKSMLSQRTVRDALGRLREVGVVAEEVYIPDARQNLYTLAAVEEEAVAEPDGGERGGGDGEPLADAEANVGDRQQ